ncbi:polysaccharide deacetylase family protein [Citrobacter meridianamericanus]|uniref:polysaccharide deacetylase family protein n=1 Tax=Citrobacter meridianamericanus TaxID=2894201 RepID=UPI00351CDAD6
MYRGNLPILMYHHVSRKSGLKTLSISAFREQMKWLAETGWYTVKTEDIESFYQGNQLPRKSVMLTFYNGFVDNWFYAFPVLKEFNLNAHIFLITGLIGEGPARRFTVDKYSHQDCEVQIRIGNADNVMLRWHEVREMYNSGRVAFHPHSRTHTQWGNINLTPEAALTFFRSDILLAREFMKRNMGECSHHLCWHDGYYNSDYISVAAELGFRFLYTTEKRVNNFKNGTLHLGRISMQERQHLVWLKRRLFCYTMPVFSSLYSLYKN